MDVYNQKILVLGVSKSGYSVAKYLLSKNNKCYLFEELDKPHIRKNVEELVGLGCVEITANEVDIILHKINVLVISPGVPINHFVAVKAKKLGIKIMGELEFGYNALTPRICAITGTNGKTTTISLLENIFSKTKISARTLGNIGTPLTKEVEEVKKDDVLLTEVSSFQLESINRFCPHVSAILNVAPDHIERHYTFENYLFLKKRIFKNQSESEYCVLNYDDEILLNCASECKAKIIWVSLKGKVNGAYLENDSIYFRDEEIIKISHLPLVGEHNVYNCMFAVAIAKIFGLTNEEIVNGITTFKGVKHRIELIACKKGVNYYNDSKSTNTASTISAIKSLKTPLVLILGGSEKGEDYTNMFEELRKAPLKQIILTGASRFNMMDVAGRSGFANLTLTGNFEKAVQFASTFADYGDSVLLSPACASFDSFASYEERGDCFRKIVGELPE